MYKKITHFYINCTLMCFALVIRYNNRVIRTGETGGRKTFGKLFKRRRIKRIADAAIARSNAPSVVAEDGNRRKMDFSTYYS